MLAFLRGDADVLVVDHDHRVGPRHPAGEHAHRRARRHARSRAALPDPRTGGTQRRRRPRVPLLPGLARALAGGACAPRDARGPHRARRRLRDRDAGPGDQGSRRPARERSSRVTSRRSGFELYVELLGEAVAELSGRPPSDHPARPRRRGRSTPTSRRRTSAPRRRRSISTGASRWPSRRTSCASCARRPRIASGRCRAGRAPVLDPGGEAEARASRSGLPRLPRRQGDGRPARAGLGTTSAGCDPLRRYAVYTSSRGRCRSRVDDSRTAVATGRCYPGVWPLERHLIACMLPFGSSFCLLLVRGPARARGRLRRGETTTTPRRTAPESRHRVPADAVAVVAGTPIPRADVRPSLHAGRERLRGTAARVPGDRHARVRAAQEPDRRVPHPAHRSARRRRRPSESTVTDQEVADRLDRAEASVLRRRRADVPGRS